MILDFRCCLLGFLLLLLLNLFSYIYVKFSKDLSAQLIDLFILSISHSAHIYTQTHKMASIISSRHFQIAFIMCAAISTLLHRLCSAEVFTALSEMEELLETEVVLINNLEAYVAAQEHKLNYLRR